MAILTNKFLFVKTQKFVVVKQAAGKEYRDYQVRVAGFSRDSEFADTNRQQFCLPLAVIGI